MRVTTSQYEIYLISGQKLHLLSQNVFLQSIIYVLDREIDSLEQAAFLHEVKVVCLLPIPLFQPGEITMTVGRCTELEELLA